MMNLLCVRVRGWLIVALWPLLASTAARAAEEPLLVAQVASQTNASSATNARGMLIGMQVAFDEVNARGGIGGRPVRVQNFDDDLNPARMTEIVTKSVLPDARLLALVGCVNTGGLTALAKDDVFGRQAIALIAPLQGDAQVIDAGNVFPFRAGYADEVKALVQHAKTMGHARIAVVAYSIAFGPAMAKVAEQAARQAGIDVEVTIVDAAPDAIERNMAQAAGKLVAFKPTAVLMLCAGRYATELAKALRAGPASSTQLYALSVVLAENMVKALTAPKARGIVISQAVPFPFQPGVALVGDYQRAMKSLRPEEPLSFATLEGFAAGRIALEALRRAGPGPTRERVAKALLAAGEIDLGGIFVKYGPSARLGWRRVDLTMIAEDGRLVR